MIVDVCREGQGSQGGVVRDVWVDRSEPQVRFLEVTVAGGSRNVLLPIYIADISNHRIRRVDLQTGTIESIAGNGERKPGIGEESMACRSGGACNE